MEVLQNEKIKMAIFVLFLLGGFYLCFNSDRTPVMFLTGAGLIALSSYKVSGGTISLILVFFIVLLQIGR